MSAKIFESFADIDVLSQPATVEVKATGLKAGMVLVDPELLTPAIGIDHRVRATRNSGDVAFLVADLENGGWRNLSLFSSSVVKVVAR